MSRFLTSLAYTTSRLGFIVFTYSFHFVLVWCDEQTSVHITAPLHLLEGHNLNHLDQRSKLRVEKFVCSLVMVNWFYYGNARSNKTKLEPICSEVALQHP